MEQHILSLLKIALFGKKTKTFSQEPQTRVASLKVFTKWKPGVKLPKSGGIFSGWESALPAAEWDMDPVDGAWSRMNT